jgi:hypothetical protein
LACIKRDICHGRYVLSTSEVYFLWS